MDQSDNQSLQTLLPNLKPFLTNPAPFHSTWQDASYYYESILQVPVMVVGAGGLGCQIVKNLALSGIRNIHLVDMDTVDFTNLNRQFMFRTHNVGKSKTEAVASFVSKRCPGVKITTYNKRVQEIPFSVYLQFPVIIGGLDNVEARKYLNNIVFLINQKSQETRCYYIDGATEGFEGQALLVDPFKTSCYQCSLFQGLAEKPKVNYCTIANTPRTPEHCIQYVLEVLWEQERKNEARDTDNLEHMQWVYQKAKLRAEQFKIQGVTEMLALGVTKNIIPAIASTNALVAAVCTNQVFKILTGTNPAMQNYILYRGGTSVGSDTYAAARQTNCRACTMRDYRLDKMEIEVTLQTTLQQVLLQVRKQHQFVVKPFITYNGSILLNPGDSERYPHLRAASLNQLIEQNRLMKQSTITLLLTDKCLSDELRVDLLLKDS